MHDADASASRSPTPALVTADDRRSAEGPATIVFVAYLPGAEKGGQVNLKRLLERLDRSVFRPVVVVPAEGSLAEQVRAMGLPVHVVGVRHPSAGRWWTFRLHDTARGIARLHRLLVRERARAVVVDGADHVFPAWLAARPRAVPIVWHAQTSFETRHDRSNVRRAAAVVGCSDLVTRRLAALGAGARAISVPNAVDTDRFRPGGDKVEALAREPGVLYVGEMGRAKGLDDLVRAMPHVLRDEPAARLWVAGRGEPADTKRLAALARNVGVEHAIRWLGYRSDLPALLRTAACFVLPSHAEGLSLALLEAMASGCPVVATDIPGNRALVTSETGLLSPVSAPAALGRAIGEVLRDREAARARARVGRERVLARHRIDDFVLGFEAALRRVVS